jgi:hypothetical protein
MKPDRTSGHPGWWIGGSEGIPLVPMLNGNTTSSVVARRLLGVHDQLP